MSRLGVMMDSMSYRNHTSVVVCSCVQSLFIGRGLHNEEAAITYHLRPDIPFAFPDFAAGFLISSELIKM